GLLFRVWSPATQSDEVEIDDNVYALKPAVDGVWSGHVGEARPGTRYRYRLNGELSRPDPYSRSQPDGPHGPSEVVDPAAFEWHNTDWRGITIQGLVIYQVHVGTATRAGTLDALIDDLPRIQALG